MIFVMRYPLFLDLVGQKVVVIGAGQVAERKIRLLLAAEADITVISPQATDPFANWLASNESVGCAAVIASAICEQRDWL